jgi:protein-disulfide isomerase
LARIIAVSLSFVVFLALIGPGCKAQSPNTSGTLSPEAAHRIRNEIRSRYSVPSQIQINLSEPGPSNQPGFDQIVVTFTGGSHSTTHDFLVSKDRKTLAHLETIDISQDIMSKIDMKARPVRGNANARVTIVNYDDFQCPYCARMHSEFFPGLLQAYGDRVKIFYKDYPLVEIHPWAMHAAVDANCVAEQDGGAYWDFADYVHSHREDISGHSPQEAFANLDHAAAEQIAKHHLDLPKAQACFTKQDDTAVRASIKEGDSIGVDSTPTMLINGERINGLVPPEAMRAILDRALAEAGQPGVGPGAPPSDAKDTKK